MYSYESDLVADMYPEQTMAESPEVVPTTAVTLN